MQNLTSLLLYLRSRLFLIRADTHSCYILWELRLARPSLFVSYPFPSSKSCHKTGDTFLSVKIEQFAASSIDIRLICFTKTKHYLEWMSVKDTLALEIKTIVEKNKASFAFPSTSIYVEKNL